MDNQLTVADIAMMKSLLEEACARGAFHANEMSQVGMIYDKITGFLQQAALKSQQPES